MKTQKIYCGYISIIGKVNVGKSTFLNKIIGKKISIASRKKYTTQNNIIGIVTQDAYQFIYVDTPGILLDRKKKNIIYEQKKFYKIIKISSIIIFIIDQIAWIEDYQIIFNQIKNNNIPIIILINKIDKINNKMILLPFIDFLKNQDNVIDIIPISIQKIKNLNFLNDIVKNYLPKKQHIYPSSYCTTNSQFFTISEIVREQLICFLGDELPNGIKVIIESFQYKRKEIFITAIVKVKNVRHKKMIIGTLGNKIKKISIIARQKIEQEFLCKTHLFLWVK